MFFLPCVNCTKTSLHRKYIMCTDDFGQTAWNGESHDLSTMLFSFLLREQMTSLVSKFGLNLIINQSVICYLSVHHLRAVTSLESTLYSSQEITNPWGQLSPVNYISTNFSNHKGICEHANLSVTLHSVS